MEGWGFTLLSIKQEENRKSIGGFSNVMVTHKSTESHFVRWLFVKIDGIKGQNEMCWTQKGLGFTLTNESTWKDNWDS